MLSRSLPPINVVNAQYASRIASVLAKAFASDALNRAAILALDSLPNDAVIPPDRWIKHLLPSIEKKAASGALLVEAGNWAAVALWVPPTVKYPPPDLSGLSAPLVEYFHKVSEAKKRHLANREYWYLNLLGRHPERKEPGVIRALFEPYLLQAREAGFPTWLEATNEHARDVYAHFGFEVVEEVVIGEGCLDGKGNLVAGGEGVAVYGMIAKP